MIIFFTGTVLYITIGAVVSHAIRPFVEEQCGEEGKHPAHLLAALSVAWPLTMLGFGAGWGIETHESSQRLKCEKHVQAMKTKLGVDPMSGDEWDKFITYLAENSSKEQLEMLVTTTGNGIHVPREKFKAIILGELANRDLLEV